VQQMRRRLAGEGGRFRNLTSRLGSELTREEVTGEEVIGEEMKLRREETRADSRGEEARTVHNYVSIMAPPLPATARGSTQGTPTSNLQGSIDQGEEAGRRLQLALGNGSDRRELGAAPAALCGSLLSTAVAE
jgi:hypothetical protein